LDLQLVGRNYLISKANKIDPQQVDVQGTDANIFVGSVSEIAYLVVLQLAYSINRLFLDGAEGDDLDRYAWDRYQLTRKGASAAVGPEVLSRLSGNNPAGTVPAGTQIKSQSGYVYITTQAGNFTSSTGTLSDTTVTVNVRAVAAGKLSQVGANALTQFAQPAQLFDQTITCNNLVATAGGEDVEDDDTFRERIRGFWTAQQRGILSAIEYGAIQVSGVVTANAVEVLGTPASPALAALQQLQTAAAQGTLPASLSGLPAAIQNAVAALSTLPPARLVYLYVADSSGVANSTLVAAVQSALNSWRAAGIQVIIFPSIPQIVSVILALAFSAGVDTVGLSAQVQAAVLNYVNSLACNQPLLLSALYSVLQRFATQGLIVGQGTIVAPAGDLVPTPGQTLRAFASGIQLVA
jgi:uncharacterized phage protein gp47/JayE